MDLYRYLFHSSRKVNDQGHMRRMLVRWLGEALLLVGIPAQVFVDDL
jgi:hypothetical protein